MSLPNFKFPTHRFPACLTGILLVFIAWSCTNQAQKSAQRPGWETYRGDPSSNQYSNLDEINQENVSRLKLAWSYRTGGAGDNTSIQCNPIIIDSTLYGTTPDMRVIALNARTGKQLWTFDAGPELHSGVNRGVTYWHAGSDRRIFFCSGQFLFAINALNGKPIPSFGNGGKIDLREHLGVNPEVVTITVSSPGIIYQNLIILGSAVGEGYDSAPGHIRAYDVLTGEMAWIFHTIPQTGEYGRDTWSWPASDACGGANAWGGLSLDESRGWVFAATGSAAFDFYGGNRKGENLFANCILALDAKTGNRIWHYQMTHHDLWDYDPPCAPNLVTISLGGKARDVVVQPTKMGLLFVLDRETGIPVWPIEEREVPPSQIRGEKAWPTQPIPTLPEPFTRIGFTPEAISDLHQGTKAFLMNQLDQMQFGSIYTPPSMEGTVSMPGTRGGAEWSGAAVDPSKGILYINANEIPNILQLRWSSSEGDSPLDRGRSIYQANCAVCHGLDRNGSPPTFPPLVEIGRKYHPDTIASIIRNGKGAMPANPQYSGSEISAITAFLILGKSEEDPAKPDSLHNGRFVINGYRQFLDAEGYPAIKPPWGTLTAIDLNSGKRIWQRPLGEYPELLAEGIPMTGTQNLGGCVVTAGGLLFVGATKDEKFRAFAVEDGSLLWETKLPFGGYATPATYQINGEQFVVIAAGGGGKNGTPAGDYYLAYKLDDGTSY